MISLPNPFWWRRDYDDHRTVTLTHRTSAKVSSPINFPLGFFRRVRCGVIHVEYRGNRAEAYLAPLADLSLVGLTQEKDQKGKDATDDISWEIQIGIFHRKFLGMQLVRIVTVKKKTA